MRTCKLMIDDEITYSSNSRWAASDKGRVAHMIWSRLDRTRTTRLLKHQIGVLSTVMGVVTGYSIMDVHARHIGHCE